MAILICKLQSVFCHWPMLCSMFSIFSFSLSTAFKLKPAHSLSSVSVNLIFLSSLLFSVLDLNVVLLIYQCQQIHHTHLLLVESLYRCTLSFLFFPFLTTPIYNGAVLAPPPPRLPKVLNEIGLYVGHNPEPHQYAALPNWKSGNHPCLFMSWQFFLFQSLFWHYWSITLIFKGL